MNKEDRIQKLLHRIRFEDLSEEVLKESIDAARREDLEGRGLANPPTATGDVTSALLARSGKGYAHLHARETIVACGLPLVPLVLQAYHRDLAFSPVVEDGTAVQPGASLGLIQGPIAELLMAERVLLNFLQFLSGVATQTDTFAKALADSSTRLLDTRKTTPGFRMLQKYAVACGGGWNHRLGLFDRVMLKDNHLAAGESTKGLALTELVKKAREKNPGLMIEVEVDHLDQIPAVLDAEPDKLMLDNFSLPDLKTAVDMIGQKACTEATGGITVKILPALGRIGLDFVSTGALVHQATWKDIGLDWQ